MQPSLGAAFDAAMETLTAPAVVATVDGVGLLAPAGGRATPDGRGLGALVVYCVLRASVHGGHG